MQDKLQALSDDALVRLKIQIDAEFKKRRRTLFSNGKMATFFSEKYDRDIQIMITGRGPKNIMGYECNDYGNKIGLQWRVHPSTLLPVLPKPKPIVAPTGVGKDRPAAAAAATW